MKPWSLSQFAVDNDQDEEDKESNDSEVVLRSHNGQQDMVAMETVSVDYSISSPVADVISDYVGKPRNNFIEQRTIQKC